MCDQLVKVNMWKICVLLGVLAVAVYAAPQAPAEEKYEPVNWILCSQRMKKKNYFSFRKEIVFLKFCLCLKNQNVLK